MALYYILIFKNQAKKKKKEKKKHIHTLPDEVAAVCRHTWKINLPEETFCMQRRKLFCLCVFLNKLSCCINSLVPWISVFEIWLMTLLEGQEIN